MEEKKSLVLLIDDNVDFAREYSETLEKMCGVKVLYATTADSALKLIKENSIKVAIIDQVMPTRGTVLFSQIKKIDPYIKTILLTAEADRHDLTVAANMGFDITLLKEDEDMDTIPIKVLILISQYNAQKIENEQPIQINTKKNVWYRKKYDVKYYVLKYEVIDKEFVDENSWVTRNIVEKGESLTFESEFNYERDFSYSDSFKIENVSSLGLESEQIIQFKNNLSTKMATDFSNTYTESLKNIFKRKKTLELPKEEDNLVSRTYEYTKVYHQIKVYIKKVCTCCNETSITALTVYMPIPVIKYRLTEYYSDKFPQITMSGEIKA